MSKLACFGKDSFIHPGLLHNETDIQRMKEAVNNEKGTIYEGFKVLLESDFSKAIKSNRKNIHAYNKNNVINKYDTPYKIMDEHYAKRYFLYQK